MKSLRIALPWVIFLGIGTWLSPLPGPAPDRARPTPPTLDKAVVNQKLATMQIPFIANQGQRDPQVKFYAPTLSGTTFVTQTGELVYALPGRSLAQSPASQDKSEVRSLKSEVRAPQSRRGVVLRETLVGGRVQAITDKQEAVTKINTFHGNDPAQWRRNLSTYEAVSLGEVYTGVELTLKARGKSVEKLFSIQPGAAPEQIRVQVRGGKGLAVTEAGELTVETAEGAVHFSQPVAYQEGGGGRQAVEVAHVVEEDTYGFRVGAYDRERELVIDPILAATFLGGNEFDGAEALALDSAGNVYVAGAADSFDFPGVDAGSADPTLVGSDAFVAKLDAGLSTILAATFLGGGAGICGGSQSTGSCETARALALDSASIRLYAE